MSPLVVLDTNVVLDAWWFGDAAAVPLASAIAAGQVRWVATRAMHDEVVEVLGRPAFARDPGARQSVLAALEAWAWMHEPTAVQGAPSCADPDDQVFVDLAIGAGARWLVSRDRAVLALAGALRRWGVEVLAPGHWGPGP